ncbi:Hypothetical protein RG1141_CH19070 [Neorhizobium galegae bv. officinalis bv. officinalis str. HAMBI 1141]|jgi:hypothetical protein|uniref:Uncharacterized protein n=1 Tax=Neorhizobium galegae bv. officinalis bv. officinalis str. HAMBI 1141 TaxID=1028801 RepID=A0A068T6T7_NEOGA|nr:hypothetical protein [Neorhizobium galegae]CDN54247.1 Hypothetical protein RG1141_CH19070 [Neorhizobium galegae bv. officinalis bv. officinalis str. HAMBI 1141]
MQQPPKEPVLASHPAVPSAANPVPPTSEAPSDRLPETATNPHPHENDARAKYTPQDLVTNYGLSAQEAQRLIDRFGPFAAELDFMLAGKGRPRKHRRQDMERSAEDIAFG